MQLACVLILSSWYAKFALLASHEQWSMLLSLLSALEFIEFDLKLNEANLDIRIQHDQPGYLNNPFALHFTYP